MRRREFVQLAASAAALRPLAAQGQQPQHVPRLCFLTFEPGTPETPSTRLEGLFQGVHELGYVNRQTLTVDYLSANGRTELFPAPAAECVRLKADIIAV